MKISFLELSDDALEGVIKDFILREGTDYGEVEYSLDQKIKMVKTMLSRNEVEIHFDEDTDTCTIVATS